MLAIAVFFLAHWWVSVFFQSFYLHRYCAHGMLTMSKGWERFFHFCTFVAQGSSFLMPRGYMILHREHHAYSDTEKDPHSPHVFRNLWTMMAHTKDRYRGIVVGTIEPESRFDGECPSWPALDRIASSWTTRIAFGLAYTLFYVKFAPHWAFYLLLPFHYLMGPVHGAVVNWAGHMYGYRNFNTSDKPPPPSDVADVRQALVRDRPDLRRDQDAEEARHRSAEIRPLTDAPAPRCFLALRLTPHRAPTPLRRTCAPCAPPRCSSR